MKWFFAFNQMSEQSYGDFVRVAVLSARENTTLEMFCLYDGQPTELTAWLERQGVTVFTCRFRFAKWWEDFSERKQEKYWARIALGAFLRMELPDVMLREGLEDEFALYTDCDVIFKRDVVPLLQPLRPRYFAVAPEFCQNNKLYTNSGVMLMNVVQLRHENPALMKFAEKHMEQASQSAYDQGIYRAYFNPLHRFAWKLRIPDRLLYLILTRLPIHSWQWDDLPPELNWKSYWGENHDAYIFHFHGLKPTQREELKRGTLPKIVSDMQTPYWEQCANEWESWLARAKQI